MKILSDKKISFKQIAYMKEGISIKEIESILKMLNLRAADIIRTSDAKLKEMKINIQDEEKTKKAIHENPGILQRPIIIYNEKCIIGRPPEKILEIL